MDLEKMIEIINDEDFIKLWILGHIDESNVMNNQEFLEQAEPILTYMEEASYEDTNVLEEIICKSMINLFKKDIKFFKEIVTKYDFTYDDYDLIGKFIEDNEEIYLDEELIYNIVRNAPIASEKIFKYYLEKNEQRFLKHFRLIYRKGQLVPNFLNKSEYIKKFIENGREDIIRSFGIDIPLELFSLALSKGLKIFGNDLFVNTKEKLLLALNEYNDIAALRVYLNYSKRYDTPGIRIDLDIVKSAVENCYYHDFGIDEFILDYDSTFYLINKNNDRVLEKYVSNYPDEYENIKSLLSLALSKNIYINLNDYILEHKELLEMAISSGNIRGSLYKIVDEYADKYLGTEKFDISILELALKNGCYINNTQLFHNKDYVSLMLDYGYNDAFQKYYKYIVNNFSSDDEIRDKFDTELILKSGYFISNYQIEELRDKFNDIVESIMNSVNDGEPLSEDLKQINDDPIILYLMAGFKIKEDMLYNYDYIKNFIIFGHTEFTEYLNKFIENCEKGLVSGRLFDKELLSLALNRHYFIDVLTPQSIITNYDYMLEIIKRKPNAIRYYKGEVDLEIFKIALINNNVEGIKLTREMVEYAIVNGYPEYLNSYARQGGLVDDDLIRLAIKNSYVISSYSPKEIFNNYYEYLKLSLLSIKKNDYLKHDKCRKFISNYNSYLKSNEVDNMKEIDSELLDVAFSIMGKSSFVFNENPVISSYEMCEHFIKKGGEHVLAEYLLYINKNPDKECKLPDFNLFILESFNKLEGFSDRTLSKHLNSKEIDTIKLFMILRNLLESECIINVENIGEFFTPNGVTDKLYDVFKKNNYALFKELNQIIIHNDDLIQNGIPDDLFNFYKTYLIEYLHINNDKIDIILSKIPNGKNIILYLNSNSIMEFLTLSNEEMDKVIELFNIPKFGFNEFKDKVYDSVKQEQFTHDYPLFRDIFVHFRGAINYNNEKEITRLKYLVNSILPNVSYEEIDNYIELAYKGDYNSLHNLCNQFTKKAREIYRKENNDLLSEYSFPFKYNRTEFIKKLGTNHVLKTIIYSDIIGHIDIDEDMFNILKRILLKDPTVTKEDKQKYGKYTNKLSKFIYVYTEELVDGKEEVYLSLVEDELNKEYYIDDVNMHILTQLAGIDISFIKKLISNEKLYNKFIELNRYYKIGSIPYSFNKVISNALNKEIKCNFQDLSKYIMHFSSFIDLEIKKQNADSTEVIDIGNMEIKFMTLLKYLISVNSEIKEISRILTQEDYQLIEKNPGPNSSGLDSDKRLKESISLIPKLYDNHSISIPSFDENISLNNKKINVIVGNRTNTCNLTHGERTGACMRIGGAGSTLFNFCIHNINGFHIRFEEPYTHEYISRVSGFRNGNTVFLNQLRNSSNKELYSDLELVEYTKIVANKLIELTRDSEYPIENVVISGGYAIKGTNIPKAKLDINNIKEGLPFFYTDVSKDDAYLLASTSNSTDIHVDTDKTNIPCYKPVRDKVYGIEIGIDKLSQLINSRYSIKILLNNEDYTMIEDLVSDNLIDGYVGTDFYVYLDSDYNIHYDYFDMDNYHDKDVSLEEMNKYKEILMNKYNISEKRY